MHKKNIVIISAVFISLLTMNFRCGKDVWAPYEHKFQAEVDIYPLKKTYSLSDTIWLQTDVPGKVLFDIVTNQKITADTGRINFRAGFNEFGTYITSPANGFCDVITASGVNVDRTNSHWGTLASYTYGCGQPDYKIRIGFKPNHKGTYYLSLDKNWPFESCPNKIIPYYATITFIYKNVDLNEDIFNSLSKNDQGGNDGRIHFHDDIVNRRVFVFRVE